MIIFLLFSYLIVGLVVAGATLFVFAVENEEEVFDKFHKYVLSTVFIVVPLWPLIVGLYVGFLFLDKFDR